MQADSIEKWSESSGEGGNDTQGTLHALAARPAGRDGEPVPYEIDWHNVTNRAGQGSNDTQGTLHALAAHPAGREKVFGVRWRYGRILLFFR